MSAKVRGGGDTRFAPDLQDSVLFYSLEIWVRNQGYVDQKDQDPRAVKSTDIIRKYN